MPNSLAGGLTTVDSTSRSKGMFVWVSPNDTITITTSAETRQLATRATAYALLLLPPAPPAERQTARRAAKGFRFFVRGSAAHRAIKKASLITLQKDHTTHATRHSTLTRPAPQQCASSAPQTARCLVRRSPWRLQRAAAPSPQRGSCMLVE